MKDGAYRFFPSERSSHSIVCEIMCGFVSECGEEGWRQLSAYAHGKFVALVELPDIREFEAWWPQLPDGYSSASVLFDKSDALIGGENDGNQV
jgi:hypothetical protein